MLKSVAPDNLFHDLVFPGEGDGVRFVELLAKHRQLASDSSGSGASPISIILYRGGPYTPSQARHLVTLIEEYRKLPPEERNGGKATRVLSELKDLGVNTPDALLLMPPQPEFIANVLAMTQGSDHETWTKEKINEHLDRLDPPIKLPPNFWEEPLENNLAVLEPMVEANAAAFELSLSSPPFEPQASLLEGMEDASGEDIVAKLEEAGYYSFLGDRANELREATIEIINRSAFFKRSLIDSVKASPKAHHTFDVTDHQEGRNGHINNNSGAITLDVELEGDKLLYTLAHEMFHSFGIRDAADMVQSLDVFVAESGIPENERSKGAGPETATSVDYELYQATLDDWNAAGALRSEDYYNNDTPEMKEAMKRIFGPGGRNLDPNQAFSDSCQKFDGDRDRIIQAYFDAKDGGKVEALRAKQLEELGINVEDLNKIVELGDWYADNISIDNRRVATFDNEFPKEKISELGEIYRATINADATDAEISDWIMGLLEQRVEREFNGDGAEAREILHNHYVDHGGKETMAGLTGSFDEKLNEAVDIYANGGIDTETRALFGFNQGDGPIKPLFQEMVRFYVTNINPEATAEDAGLWVAEQIEGRLGNATGQDEEKLEIYGNYVNKSDRNGREDAIDVATEVFHELELDPLPLPMY